MIFNNDYFFSLSWCTSPPTLDIGVPWFDAEPHLCLLVTIGLFGDIRWRGYGRPWGFKARAWDPHWKRIWSLERLWEASEATISQKLQQQKTWKLLEKSYISIMWRSVLRFKWWESFRLRSKCFPSKVSVTFFCSLGVRRKMIVYFSSPKVIQTYVLWSFLIIQFDCFAFQTYFLSLFFFSPCRRRKQTHTSKHISLSPCFLVPLLLRWWLVILRVSTW